MPSVRFLLFPAVNGSNVLKDVRLATTSQDQSFLKSTNFFNFGDRLFQFDLVKNNNVIVRNLTDATGDTCVGYLFLHPSDDTSQARASNSVAYLVDQFEITEQGTSYSFAFKVQKIPYFDSGF